MKVSLNWLKEFADAPVDARELGKKLTNIGLAVDAMEVAGGDTIFELDVTTNRPDCLNHLGVAREISAVFGTPLRKPAFKLRESAKATSSAFSISISDPDLCARYCGRYIIGVKIGPSPDWLKQRLEAVGVRSINNVADISNYVMMELGQPLHAFDADTLSGQEIIVRRAEIEERMTTLDGIERALNPSVLVIADARRPVALAGVMGGSETEITAKTTNVFLESAHFLPQSIRKTARALGMNTEASYRFERGADIEIAGYACDRAAALIQELAGGEVLRGVIDVYPSKHKRGVASLRRQRIPAFLGADVDNTIVENIFARLEFKSEKTSQGWNVEVPGFRVDISGEQDLLEEIARHHGFDKFPSTLPAWKGFGSSLPGEAEERRLRSILSGAGYGEIYTYSFSDESTERSYRREVDPVKFINPMTEDATTLRTSLVPGILKTLQWNLNRGARDLQFYELSKVYSRAGERRELILCGCGSIRNQSVHETARDFTFYDFKGDVETILATFGAAVTLGSENLPDYYHPGRSARFGAFAVFGEIHPEHLEAMKIRHRVVVAEIDIDRILSARSQAQVQPIPRFPAIRRDFSLLLDKGTQYAAVHRIIAESGISEVARIEPFDRIETGSFPESKYSLSISVVYQSNERTLTDAEVETFDRRILELLEQRLGAQLRK